MLTINGTTIKTPTRFNVEKFPLVAKSGRVSSGKMTADLLGWKRKFNFEYSTMTMTELEVITGILISTAFFFTLGYSENGASKTCVVYPGAIPYDLLRSDTWQLTDVKFSLIEQ